MVDFGEDVLVLLVVTGENKVNSWSDLDWTVELELEFDNYKTISKQLGFDLIVISLVKYLLESFCLHLFNFSSSPSTSGLIKL